jgi:hypothetical protein
VSLRKILPNLLVSGLLLPAAAMFAVLELGSVDRTQCNWETFEKLCSDYKGMYGLACALLFMLWAALTYAINRPGTKVR